MENTKLKTLLNITATIQLLSGLHIGSGNDDLRIGGIDSPVIKNPINSRPYIPGSSLKGKIRHLLEWATGRADNEHPFAVKGKATDFLCEVFGNGASNSDFQGGPTRVIFHDAQITEKSYNYLIEKDALTEVKTEISIDRLTGTSKKGGLRHIERVPAGAEFDFSISIRIFDTDDEQKIKRFLLHGLKLLELDALGGSGSRGYGKIMFKNLNIKDSLHSNKDETVESLTGFEFDFSQFQRVLGVA